MSSTIYFELWILSEKQHNFIMFLHEFPKCGVRKRTNLLFEQISAFPAKVPGQCKLALKMSKVMQKLMQIVKMYIVGTWGAHTYM